MKLMPYFLTNKEWYVMVIPKENNGRGYKLTDKAPPEAIESYKEFYAEEKEIIDGQEFIINL